MKFGIIGAGAMGTGIGQSILKENYDLVVYNRTSGKVKSLVEKGAFEAPSVLKVIQQAEIVLFTVVSGKITLEMIENHEVLKNINGKTIVNTATSTVEETEQMDSLIKSNGGHFIELAIDALPESMADKTGTVKIGSGDDNEEQFSYLNTIFGNIVRVGGVGDVSKNEMVRSFNSLMLLVKSAFTIKLVEKYGLEMSQYVEEMEMSDPIAKYYLPTMLEHNFDSGIGTVAGEISILLPMIASFNNKGINTDILESILKLYNDAERMGYSEKDIYSILDVI